MKDVVIGIVQKGNQFAFLQRVNDAWTFPSGKVEPGETLEAAAYREIHEETGLQTKFSAYLGTREVNDENLHYYLHDYVAGNLSVTEEINFKRADWMTGDQIFSITGGRMFPPVANYIKRFTAQLPKLGPE